MSIDPVTASGGNVPSTTAAQQAVTAAQQASGVAGTGAVTGSTKINSLDDLKQKARPVFDMLMMSMAQHIKDSQNQSNARIKKILADAESGR